MAKKTIAIKAEAVKEKPIEEIIAENQKLRQTIETMGKVSSGDKVTSRYIDEMNKINKRGRVDSDKIKVQEFADHKNISLWTPEGKRIGPLHRENALVALKRFFDLGLMLTADQPTIEQIEEYKQTDEYKELIKQRKAIRDRKERTRRSGQMQKLAEEIAKMSGTTVEAINNILKARDIKPLSEKR